ncbi:recombinase family protein [Niallia circulans]|uniref:recombinase family protein n=1 Tax=Niallia circulans TaxID=1397 RepID=UPI00148F974B|nr:recombinase family protein [Niallia circulans]QJX63021.1 recombinase family protein [Niallia circulans]QJX63082.1 recombinase family protein [Niallia circulans]
MTVGIYIRVSTQEQANEGYSIGAQKERLIAYCAAQGWNDFKFYIDEGISAKDMNRPELQRLLDDVKNRRISMILVYRLDRFTRRVKDLYEMLEMLEKHNCSFKSATELYDTSNAMGRMFIGLVALLAQWETENLSERIKVALEQKVSDGERVGAIPYGFDLTEDEKLIKNEKSKVVYDMIEKTFNGMSATQLANYLNKTNDDRTWHVKGVLRILKNPAIYGATRWNDKVYENTHEGIISKSQYKKLQEILNDRSKHHRREVAGNYLFQGKLSCPTCKKPLAVNRYLRKRKDGTEYQSTIYKCSSCYLKGKKIKQIGEKRFLDALYIYMKNIDLKGIDITEEPDETKHLTDQLKSLEKKREKYQRAWASDLISDSEFEQRMLETRDLFEELKRKLSEKEEPIQVDIEEIKNVVFTFNQTFHFLTQEEKRMFISRFIKKIDYELIPQPPQRPDRCKYGKDLVTITDVLFY